MSFICQAHPGYDWKKSVLALTPGQYMTWRERAKRSYPELPDNQASFDPKKDYGVSAYSPVTMDGDEVEAWTAVGIELAMSRVKGVASNSADVRNTIYQISVANVGLMQIRRVEVLEDCSTDDLQRELDRGWRLLAVCPPNDARRPSYVVGHFEGEA